MLLIYNDLVWNYSGKRSFTWDLPSSRCVQCITSFKAHSNLIKQVSYQVVISIEELRILKFRNVSSLSKMTQAHQIPVYILLGTQQYGWLLWRLNKLRYVNTQKSAWNIINNTYEICLLTESPGWFDVSLKNSAGDVTHEQARCRDESANHQLSIAVAFWIIQIVSAEECSSLKQDVMKIHCPTHSVILNVKATQNTCSLNVSTVSTD